VFCLIPDGYQKSFDFCVTEQEGKTQFININNFSMVYEINPEKLKIFRCQNEIK